MADPTNRYRMDGDGTSYIMLDDNTYLLADDGLPEDWEQNPGVGEIGGGNVKEPIGGSA